MTLLTFKINNILFGINVNAVKEINRHIVYTRILPKRENIVGLYNMRGEIVSLFDLSTRLNYDNNNQKNQSTTAIIMREYIQNSAFGFLIGEAEDVVKIDEKKIQKNSVNFDENISEVLFGVYEYEGNIMLVLDETKILSKVKII